MSEATVKEQALLLNKLIEHHEGEARRYREMRAVIAAAQNAASTRAAIRRENYASEADHETVLAAHDIEVARKLRTVEVTEKPLPTLEQIREVLAGARDYDTWARVEKAGK